MTSEIKCGSVVSAKQHSDAQARSECHDRRVSATILSGSAGLLAVAAIGAGWHLLRRDAPA
jgi:hypothetical protein